MSTRQMGPYAQRVIYDALKNLYNNDYNNRNNNNDNKNKKFQIYVKKFICNKKFQIYVSLNSN